MGVLVASFPHIFFTSNDILVAICFPNNLSLCECVWALGGGVGHLALGTVTTVTVLLAMNVSNASPNGVFVSTTPREKFSSSSLLSICAFFLLEQIT